MFTPKSTWTPGIALKSPNSLQRNPSTASSLMHISVPRTTRMRKRSGRPLDARPWETTATYTAAATSCFWQMSEIFRKTCLGQYGLDPGHYYISPGLSWDALLKKTGVELELLTDYDQHLFIEKGMRGGISMVPKRHAKANNPLVEGCDPEMPSSHIQYLDVNNLYGWAMSQPLPTGALGGKRTASCWPKPLQIIQQTIQRASSLRWIWNTQKSCTRRTTPSH